MGESIRVPDLVEFLGNTATPRKKEEANSFPAMLPMTGMNAKPASVPSLVSYVSASALTRIICMAWKMGKSTSAGKFHELTCAPLVMGIGKSIFAPLVAQLKGYVKLKQHHNPMDQLSLADTLKHVITIYLCFHFDHSPLHSISKVSCAEWFL